MTKYLALVFLPLLLLVGVLSPSYAGTDNGTHGTLTAGNVSSFEAGCADVPLTFTVADEPPYWGFNGEVIGPDGSWVDSFGMNEDFGSNSVRVCHPRDKAGTYTVSGTLTQPDTSGEGSVTEDYSTTFTYTVKPKTPVSIAVRTERSHAKPCPGAANAHCWRVSVLITKSGRPWAGRQVTFQARDYAWQALARCTANRHGTCGWYVIVKKRGAAQFPLRVISAGTATTKAAVSRTFRLRYY